MIVNEKTFQKVLTIRPQLIANALSLKIDEIQIVSVEFVYSGRINGKISRFDLVVRHFITKDYYKDIYIELKTLDSSSNYEQLARYYDIVYNDKFQQLFDCDREFHYMVLESEFKYKKLKSHIDKHNTIAENSVKLYMVEEKAFKEELKSLDINSEDFENVDLDLDFYSKEQHVNTVDNNILKQFSDNTNNEFYLLNFINYLGPKYGLANSAKRYDNPYEFFTKVFKVVAENLDYDEIKCGENIIFKNGNKRTINFRKDNKSILELFANNYPLQIKIKAGDHFKDILSKLIAIFPSEEIVKTQSRGNTIIKSKDGRKLMQAYPSDKKREIFIRMEKDYHFEDELLDKVIVVLNSIFS